MPVWTPCGRRRMSDSGNHPRSPRAGRFEQTNEITSLVAAGAGIAQHTFARGCPLHGPVNGSRVNAELSAGSPIRGRIQVPVRGQARMVCLKVAAWDQRDMGKEFG